MAFTRLVHELQPAELEELRSWLEERLDRKLETPDAIALAWIRVTAGELRRRADAALLELERPGQAAEAAAKHLAGFSPPPRNRRN